MRRPSLLLVSTFFLNPRPAAWFPTTLEQDINDLETLEEQGSQEGVCIYAMRKAPFLTTLEQEIRNLVATGQPRRGLYICDAQGPVLDHTGARNTEPCRLGLTRGTKKVLMYTYTIRRLSRLLVSPFYLKLRRAASISGEPDAQARHAGLG